MHRSTFVVSDPLAGRRLRDQIAGQNRLGQRVVTLQGLAARLAGGLGGAATKSAVRQALQHPPVSELTSLAAIALLPGFARAAADTLFSAWNAGLNPAELARAPGAHARWAELAALQRHVRQHLPAGTTLPHEVVGAAQARVALAPRLLGDVTLEGIYDVPPLYRHLLEELASRVPVRWRLPASAAPAWSPAIIETLPTEALVPSLTLESCADPHHEALEALRWVRRLLVSGVPAGDIALAAVDMGTYDHALHTLVQASALPVHFAHGVPGPATDAGQFAAAMAEALLNRPTQPRVRRVVEAARAAGDRRIGGLPEDWCQELEPDAALARPAHWSRALGPLEERAPEYAALVMRLVMDLTQGPSAAATVGERWLTGTAREAWRRALTDGAADALPTSLQRLRFADSRDPACSVLWCSAATLCAWPRSHVRLLGLSARAWPRHGSDEDPLLPNRVLGSATLREVSRARTDADHLQIVIAQTGGTVVLSRPRRGSDGRVQSPSPLLRKYAGLPLTERLPHDGTDHAMSEADRRASCARELAADPALQRCKQAYDSAFSSELTPHDGLVRAGHPVVQRTLQRRHSATSLKLLLRNPHGFVATYGLGWAQPQPEHDLLELDALQRGQLLHEVLEDTLAGVQAAGGFARLQQAEVAHLVTRACESADVRWTMTRPVPPPLAWQAALRRAETMAVHMLSVTAAPSGHVRSFAELKFGYDDSYAHEGAHLPWPPNAVVTLPGTDLRLRGVIDRLDIDDERRRITVIDYKSGRPRKHTGDLDNGNELQRTLYTIAVRQLLGSDYEVAAGLLYAGAAEPLVLSQPDQSVQRLAQAAAAAVAKLASGRVLPGPGITDAFEATVLAYPAFGPGYYYRLKGSALDAERIDIDSLLAGPVAADAGAGA